MEQPSLAGYPAKYCVFLSFRGEDVRKNFVDHLYTALQQRNIYTFKDDEKLETGVSISPALNKAIEESSIAVVVFSEHYADSTWCLEELAKILECMKVKGQIVLPIFYGVDPSTVCEQKDSFKEAFDRHEKRFENEGEKVKKWKQVLSDVANLSGQNLENGNEAIFIEKIVEDIVTKLGTKLSIDDPPRIRMNPRIKELDSLIDLGSSDVRFVGIFGTSGIGKTTIAKAVYDKISSKFEGSSFIHDIKDQLAKGHHLVDLQKTLLSEILSIKDLQINNTFDGSNMIKQRLRCKKVLIILDGVDHMDQLEGLARNDDWFGAGSRIIITTTKQQLLNSHKVRVMGYYEMSVLNEGESYQLFRKYAFKKYPPTKNTKEFEELETQLISYAGGIPLTLKNLGSFFQTRGIDEWESEVDRLKETQKVGLLKKESHRHQKQHQPPSCVVGNLVAAVRRMLRQPVAD